MAGLAAQRCLRAAVGGLLLLQLPGASAWPWGSSAEKKHASDELTADTFDTYMKDHPVTAILFYAPWCFYSQQVMPAWDLAGQKLELHDPPVQLARIDAHKYGSVGERYGIQAFPTMKLFVDGAVFEYDSHAGRGWQQIVKWVNHHIDRDHVLKSAEDADRYLHDNDLNVVGLFPDGFNSSAFGKSARHFDDVMFAESQGSAISAEVATHISAHASLLCETVDVGTSSENTKDIELPRAFMHCSDAPRNPQRSEWTDRFAASVEGTKLKVKRTDDSSGWAQNLQLKCCDDEKSSAANKEKYKVPVPSLVMFMPHDERFAIYDGDLDDIHAIDKWISARRTPMVMRLTPAVADKILDSGPEKTPVLFLIAPQEEPAIEKELKDAAKLLRGRVLICLSGWASQIEKRLAEVAGIEETSGPVVTLLESARGGGGPYHSSKKYRLPVEGLKAATVVQFVSDYEQGHLKPYLKSEPEPSAEEVRTGGPVGVLVGTSFTATAHDAETDVLVDFYAPWCGHCRKFEPNYKELAKRLKHVKSLKVMKLDATRNEVEGMMITGFPTIVLFPAGKAPKQQIMYHGTRDPDDMVRWLHEYCTVKFDDRPPPQAAEDPVESGLLDPSEEDL